MATETSPAPAVVNGTAGASRITERKIRMKSKNAARTVRLSMMRASARGESG